MNTAAQEAGKFAEKINETKSSTSGWGKEIDNLGHKFTSLGGIMKIGFGLGTAKAILSAVHHELVAFGEGFVEAQKAGMGFFESLGDGILNLVGLETHLQQVTKDAKEFKTVEDQINAAREQGREVIEGKDIHYPDVPGADEAEKKLHDAYTKAAEAAKPYGEAIDKAARILEHPRTPEEAMNARKALDEASSRGLPFLQAEVGAQSAYNAYITDATKKQQEAAAAKAAKAQEKAAVESSKAWAEFYKKMGEDERDVAKFAAEREKAADEAAQKRIDDLREEMELRDTFQKNEQAARLKAKQALENGGSSTAGFGGLADLHDALQKAALGGNDQKLDKINKEQIKQTGNLDNIDKAMQKFNGAPLIWSGVA